MASRWPKDQLTLPVTTESNSITLNGLRSRLITVASRYFGDATDGSLPAKASAAIMAMIKLAEYKTVQTDSVTMPRINRSYLLDITEFMQAWASCPSMSMRQKVQSEASGLWVDLFKDHLTVSKMTGPAAERQTEAFERTDDAFHALVTLDERGIALKEIRDAVVEARKTLYTERSLRASPIPYHGPTLSKMRTYMIRAAATRMEMSETEVEKYIETSKVSRGSGSTDSGRVTL